MGEAGVGKSRLAEELAERAGAEHDALVLEGRCVPYGEANVWWPVAEALRHGCGIGPTTTSPRPGASRRARCAAGSGGREETEVERVVNGLMYLMGYEGPLDEIDADPRPRGGHLGGRHLRRARQRASARWSSCCPTCTGPTRSCSR